MVPSCPGLEVPVNIMTSVVKVESAYNPFAIGVVGNSLLRQPKHLEEAVATVKMLEKEGRNFSVGIAQVNRYNLKKYGIFDYKTAFDPCINLVAGSKILNECYSRSGNNWSKAFSCYYSGNFTVGFKHGYVEKVVANLGSQSSKKDGFKKESTLDLSPINPTIITNIKNVFTQKEIIPRSTYLGCSRLENCAPDSARPEKNIYLKGDKSFIF